MPKPQSQTQVTPGPKLEKRTRQNFSADYKLKIITEAAACAHGEIGALLRRENLYSNQLSQLRREYAEHGLDGLGKSFPTAAKSWEQRRLEQLEKENARLQRKLEVVDDCLELQKAHRTQGRRRNTRLRPASPQNPELHSDHRLRR